MKEAIFSLAGVVVGSIISASVSWITTKMKMEQDEISDNKAIELDKEKLSRAEDLEKLNKFLKLALIIYNENTSYIEVGDLYDISFYGEGLTYENAEKLILLFDSNLQFIDLKILDIYLELKNSHYYDKKINTNYQDNRISNNIFTKIINSLMQLKMKLSESKKNMAKIRLN